MSNYFIWYPYVPDEEPKTLVCFLTPGDTGYEIADGSQEFIEQILRDLQMNNEPKSWAITTCRTKYFSDYIGEEDWRDNWQIVWKIKVDALKPIYISLQKKPFYPTSAVDTNWGYDQHLDHLSEVDCLVIGDFSSNRKRKFAQKEVSKFIAENNSKVGKNFGEPIFNFHKTLEDTYQLHINLGKFSGGFFSEGAVYAENIMSIIQHCDGKIHYET